MDHQRKMIILIVVTLAFLAFVPAGCSGLPNGNFGTLVGDKEIILNITSPEEGDIIFYDVVPAYILVLGTIDAQRGIRNVSITNDLNDNYGEVECGRDYGTHFDLSCEILITDHVTIKVTDNSGFIATERRNFTSYARPPGPGDIWVKGWVVDTKGQPIPNSSIIFERTGGIAPAKVTTKSDVNGAYSMKKTSGINQKITVQKEGYQTLVREVAFRNYYNELNLTLSSQGAPVPGFNFVSAMSAIFIGLLIVDIRRRG